MKRTASHPSHLLASISFPLLLWILLARKVDSFTDSDQIYIRVNRELFPTGPQDLDQTLEEIRSESFGNNLKIETRGKWRWNPAIKVGPDSILFEQEVPFRISIEDNNTICAAIENVAISRGDRKSEEAHSIKID